MTTQTNNKLAEYDNTNRGALFSKISKKGNLFYSGQMNLDGFDYWVTMFQTGNIIFNEKETGIEHLAQAKTLKVGADNLKGVFKIGDVEIVIFDNRPTNENQPKYSLVKSQRESAELPF